MTHTHTQRGLWWWDSVCGSLWSQWRETNFTTFLPSKLQGMVRQSRSQERSLPWPPWDVVICCHSVLLIGGHFDDNFPRSRANITSGRGKSEAKFTMATWFVTHLMAGFQCHAATVAVRVSMIWSSMVIHHLFDTKVVTGIPGYRAACFVDDVPRITKAISLNSRKSQLKVIKLKQPQRQRRQCWFFSSLAKV